MKRSGLFITLFVILCCYGLIVVNGIYFNIHSDSMPLGLYRRVQASPQKGMVAATVLNDDIAAYGLERGYLVKGQAGTGIQPVLKKIVGMPGDTITVRDGQVSVNDKPVGPAVILDKDSGDRPVKRFYDFDTYTLGEGEYWLMSDYRENSWDSRYWGPVGVQYIFKPFLVFQNG